MTTARGRRNRAVALVVLATVVLAGAWGAFSYGAEVTIRTDTASVEVAATAPVAEELEASSEREAETSTEGTQPGERARGAVQITYSEEPFTGSSCAERRDCPPEQVTLPAGTRVGTCVDVFEDQCTRFDVVFELESPATLRLRSQSEPLPIRAVEPGVEGNVKIGRIESLVNPPKIPHAVFKADNLSDTAGGTDARTGIVSQADVDRTADTVRQRVIDEARRELEAQAARRDFRVADVKVDVAVEPLTKAGESSPTTSVRVRAVARGAGYREDDLLAAARLPVGRFFVPGTQRVEGARVDGQQVSATVRAQVSPVDFAMVRGMAGTSTGSARQALERRYGEDNVRIKGKPILLPWLPWRGSRIDVAVV